MFYFRKIVLAAVMVSAALLSTAGHGHGWSAGGHRIVANIAYDRLDKALRTRIVNVLRKHEAFDKYFANEMPDGLDAADQERWIFLQGAIVPDLSRHTRFDRDKWHYVNLLYFPIDGDEKALKGETKPNLSDKLPGTITDTNSRSFNCLQAFKYAQISIADSHNDAKEKAFFYCFLIHIAGDVHQPLHSTTLVTRARFHLPAGDIGGHLPIVPIGKAKRKEKKAKSLHAYWDGLHGEVQDEPHTMAQIIKRTKDILVDDENVKAGEKATADLRIKTWVAESHSIAKEFAYSKEMIKIIEDGEMTPSQPLPLIDLTKIAGYEAQAQKHANRRVAEAGFRLAEVLKALD